MYNLPKNDRNLSIRSSTNTRLLVNVVKFELLESILALRYSRPILHLKYSYIPPWTLYICTHFYYSYAGIQVKLNNAQ